MCVVCASLGDTIVHSGLLDTCVRGMCVTGGYDSPIPIVYRLLNLCECEFV